MTNSQFRLTRLVAARRAKPLHLCVELPGDRKPLPLRIRSKITPSLCVLILRKWLIIKPLRHSKIIFIFLLTIPASYLNLATVW
jgi:hypothetical protein